MFKIKFFIISLLFTSVTHHWVADVSLPKVVEKRFQRSVQKLFNGEEYTKTPIVLTDSLAAISNSYFYALESRDKAKKYVVGLTIANGCKIGGCNINAENSDEFEVFYLYSLYNIKGQLTDLKILDYQSDYGYEVTSKWWLKQFVKHSEEEYKYSKNIDAISGATTSVNSIIKEMNLNKEILTEILKHN
jgi:hypothetical protein